MKKKFAAFAAGAFLVVGAGFLLGAADGSKAEPVHVAPSPASGAGVDTPTPEYPRNEAGETYGSAGTANTPDEEPDLILVMAQNGEFGYVRKTDLDEASGYNAQSDADIAAWMARSSDDGVIPVYDVQGVKEIGTFDAAS